jgi:hypothetical protein
MLSSLHYRSIPDPGLIRTKAGPGERRLGEFASLERTTESWKARLNS